MRQPDQHMCKLSITQVQDSQVGKHVYSVSTSARIPVKFSIDMQGVKTTQAEVATV